jgi:methionine-rich copper-binding protein CopC
MTCRWVAGSRFTTFGRRLVITSAVFGLTTVGGAGVALAAPGPIGVSPAGKVVAKVPTAVSVTFRQPLRAGGARMRVLSSDREIGSGKVSTGAKTLRRELQLDAPAGKYVVEWQAFSAKGRKMTGRFSFIAAHGNGEVVRTSSPVPSPRRSPEQSPVAAVPWSGPSSAGSVPLRSVPSPSATSVSPEWISGSDPVWTPRPTATQPAAARADGGAGHSGTGSSVSTGFTVVPLAVGGLLVLAAGMVSLLNRPRLRG